MVIHLFFAIYLEYKLENVMLKRPAALSNLPLPQSTQISHANALKNRQYGPTPLRDSKQPMTQETAKHKHTPKTTKPTTNQPTHKKPKQNLEIYKFTNNFTTKNRIALGVNSS